MRALKQALSLTRRAAANAAATRLAARSFAAEAAAAPQGRSGGVGIWLGLAGAAGGLFAAKQYGYLDSLLGGSSGEPSPVPGKGNTKQGDYDAVRAMISDLLEKDPNYDDGSYGPVLVRLAWHASGSYDKATNTGGSNGATMRFNPEKQHSANAGLHIAQDFLEPVKAKFPWITYADLWTLAGAQAIEEMGGPHINWRPGRSDQLDGAKCPPDGRLPDASKGPPHIRDVFYRMGFNDQEIVALSGAHALGRCHADRSGYVLPWTNAPTTFSNMYFSDMLGKKWTKKKWDGPLQYEDKSGELMMLPTDLALIWDKKFKPWVEKYAKDEDAFFADFASAFSRLLELGVPFDAPFQPAKA